MGIHVSWVHQVTGGIYHLLFQTSIDPCHRRTTHTGAVCLLPSAFCFLLSFTFLHFYHFNTSPPQIFAPASWLIYFAIYMPNCFVWVSRSTHLTRSESYATGGTQSSSNCKAGSRFESPTQMNLPVSPRLKLPNPSAAPLGRKVGKGRQRRDGRGGTHEGDTAQVKPLPGDCRRLGLIDEFNYY